MDTTTTQDASRSVVLATHLEVRHDYHLSPADEAEAEPYALEQLHRDLHQHGHNISAEGNRHSHKAGVK